MFENIWFVMNNSNIYRIYNKKRKFLHILLVVRDWFGRNSLGIDYERSSLVAVHGTNRVQGHLGKSSQPSIA